MGTETPQPPRKQLSPWAVVGITLACVALLEKTLNLMRSSDYGDRAKRSEALLVGQEQRAQQAEQYYQLINEDQKRVRAYLDHQEKDVQRFEQILGTWERQQKEYQAYLDSLKKSQ